MRPRCGLKLAPNDSDGAKVAGRENELVEEDIRGLDIKLGQLKREYDQYFLGTRPREPLMLAGDVRKLIARISNEAIRNTALKFKFSSLCSRYQAFNRQWQDTLRKMEAGTYTRHRFRANLHERERENPAPDPGAGGAGAEARAGGRAADDPALYAAYLKARGECGQGVENLTPTTLQAALRKQEAALRQRFGDARIHFRVVVEDGKAKVKASRGG
jgi:hypothetical protein